MLMLIKKQCNVDYLSCDYCFKTECYYVNECKYFTVG